jgi:hypothetical protein
MQQQMQLNPSEQMQLNPQQMQLNPQQIQQIMEQVMQQNPEMMKQMIHQIMQQHGGIESVSEPQISAEINGQTTLLSKDQIVNILSQQQEALQRMQLEIQNKDKIIERLEEKITNEE